MHYDRFQWSLFDHAKYLIYRVISLFPEKYVFFKTQHFDIMYLIFNNYFIAWNN